MKISKSQKRIKTKQEKNDDKGGRGRQTESITHDSRRYST